MTQLIGIDVGGTHTRVRVQAKDGSAQSTHTLLSKEWLTPLGLSDPAGAATLLTHAYALGGQADSPLAIGAHGCDSSAQIAALQDALATHHTGKITVVNDAFLLAPATGISDAIGVIAGTGSIAVGADANGELLTAGGYGWMLGDPGSAPGLTREALLRALARHDNGDPPDPLGQQLLTFCGVNSVDELAWCFTSKASIHHWASAAPLIFTAAEEGSSDAMDTIRSAGSQLAQDVARLLKRGAHAEAIVTAGGVMVNQPLLQRALAEGLIKHGVTLPFHVVTADPVAGAIELAQRSTETP